MIVRITNFKSIDEVSLELTPVTILIGPPGSGKSNILDAIALIGYFNRILLLDKEYNNDASNLEQPSLILRFGDVNQLFRYHDLTKGIIIEAIIDSEKRLRLTAQFEQGRLNLKLDDIAIPWDLKTLPATPFQEVRNALSQVKDALLEARLYGYDRYGLSSSTCSSPMLCGFHLRLRGVSTRPTPKNILSEFGWNATNVIKISRDVVIQLNEILREYIDEKIEIKVLSSGSIVVFDYDYEVNSLAVSDSIFRMLYYLIAIRTAMNYAKLYGLEKKFVLLLEEPEAHVFPYFLDLLSDYIARAKEYLYIVIATHNPLLVSMLWDVIKELRTYYVVRDRYGSTRAWEINVEKLAEELKTADELLSMPPREVVSRYVVKSGEVWHV